MLLKLFKPRIYTKDYKLYRRLCYSTASKPNWDLIGSVCLERKPVITKELSDLEMQISDLLYKHEYNLSYKSDHEIKLFKEKLVSEDLKNKGALIRDDDVSIQTAQDFEDASNNELKSFKFADRVTVKDKANDVTSYNRLLSDSLVLVVMQNIGNQPKWILPQAMHKEEESLRETAQRALSEVCGNNLQARFLGNAPCGFYKFLYPKTVRTNSVGMKIFFFKAQLIKGSVSEEVCKYFKWLPAKELDILQEDYLKIVRSFLVENE